MTRERLPLLRQISEGLVTDQEEVANHFDVSWLERRRELMDRYSWLSYRWL